MNAFEVQEKLIDDYKAYVESFVTIRDESVKAYVEKKYQESVFWPEALVQLNPAFEPGSTIQELSRCGVLHPKTEQIFRFGHTPMRLHKHQEDAVRTASSGRSYVLTTGTGSGKSLAYFIPIVDRVLRAGSGKGLKAIVVYPMNALCNSQLQALDGFFDTFESPPVTYRRYTGQETHEERERIRANPPDILLTNYVMLELILTRSEDRALLDRATGLEFLVLDELHTYRGRQGADVAMLTRRVKERTGASNVQCIGTSATLVTEGTRLVRLNAVAEVATQLFGSKVEASDIIDETLRPLFSVDSIREQPLTETTRLVASGQLPGSSEDFLANPLAQWIERTFGVSTDDEGRIVRARPITISEGAKRLSEETGVTLEECIVAIRALLLCGYDLPHPETGRSIFAFRLHQFISRGDTVFSTLDRGPQRQMTLEGQVTLPSDTGRKLLPLAFCRSCGEDYFVVDIPESVGQSKLVGRDFRDMARQADDERKSGYLWLDPEFANPGRERAFAFQADRIPDSYLTTRADGENRVDPKLRKRLQPAEIEADGQIFLTDGDGPSRAWFVRGRLPFCLTCGETWDPGVGEYTKLGSLASEGRAGATTILSLKLVQALRASDDLEDKAKKLLSFTDNRQDASLQAGHFNDFIMTSMLRAGILAAIPVNGEMSFDKLPGAVQETMNLAHDDYAAPGRSEGLGGGRALKQVLRDTLSYRIFRDLRRGWRVNQPNLEQLGLLRIEYQDVDELAETVEFWDTDVRHALDRLRLKRRGQSDYAWLEDEDLHAVLDKIIALSVDSRRRLLIEILDHFRREGAILADVLLPEGAAALKQRAFGSLNDLWGFGPEESLEVARPLQVGQRQRRGPGKAVDITPLSKTGREIAKAELWGLPRRERALDTKRRLIVLKLLVFALAAANILSTEDHLNYLLAADALVWKRETRSPDPCANEFFRDFYKTLADALPLDDSPVSIRGMTAREHTAQVPSKIRNDREQEFREGKLPVLYSSPTMELGVDISSLNAVNMRNVPPTPANYAQRSGRAGRAGQPAIVVTYCAAGSPHDQYYFHRREQMVSGVVAPPRIDLANRELITSHMHAVWLGETRVRLSSSLSGILDLGGDPPTLEIQEDVKRQLHEPGAVERASRRCAVILSSLEPILATTKWYRHSWLDELLNRAPHAFDAACDRWRALYRSATGQQQAQHRRLTDASLSSPEIERARRLYEEALRQRMLLTGDQSLGNDFYSYRYLASEGFLPGYNFPRLPLTAYIPGRHGGSDGEYLQRSRFIAISEYGPGNSIYYEGNRYRVERIDIPTSGEEGSSPTESIRICETCGYAHTGTQLNADCCVNPLCGAVLDNSYDRDNLIRLQSVVTRRVERISSEEEERQRQGFDLRTSLRFAETVQGLDYQIGDLVLEGNTEAAIVYAPAAQVWRINLGWRRRKDRGSHGFWLDTARGVWSRREDPENDTGAESADVKTPDLQKVIPYVSDRQNALLLNLQRHGLRRLQGNQPGASELHFLSLGTALKRGICATYQLEENELAMELLPNSYAPHSILFIEASEGGAGVLPRLLEESSAFRKITRAALEICHFDPDSGEDWGEHANCGLACYQCLLSYTNQTSHELLNRFLVRDLLMDWRDARVEERPDKMTREELRDELKKLTQSTLESQFVDWLHDNGYRLPDQAQKLIEKPFARPDFWYENGRVCVYVDGPHHETEATRVRDADARQQLMRRGYQIVSVTYPERWREELSDLADVFGEGAT